MYFFFFFFAVGELETLRYFTVRAFDHLLIVKF